MLITEIYSDYMIVESVTKSQSNLDSRYLLKWTSDSKMKSGSYLRIKSITHKVVFQTTARFKSAQKLIANQMLSLRWNEIASEINCQFIDVQNKEWSTLMTTLIEQLDGSLNEDHAVSLYQYTEYHQDVEEGLRISFPCVNGNSHFRLTDAECIDDEDEDNVTREETTSLVSNTKSSKKSKCFDEEFN